jgi:hypothetical protein
MEAVVWGTIALYGLLDLCVLALYVQLRLARGKPIVPRPNYGGLRR